MSTYAHLDGTRVIGTVVLDEGAGPDKTMNLVHLPAQPERTSPDHRLHFIGGSFQWIDPRTLAQAKADKWTAIKTARAAAIDTPLATPYGPFDCGPGDRQNITDAVSLLQTLAAAGQTTTVTFTTATNTAVVLTTAQMVNVGLLLGQQVQSAYARARKLREQINSATTVAGLDSVIW